MYPYRWLTVIATLFIALLLVACGSNPDEVLDNIPPAIVESIEGTEFNRLILTEKAAQRLGIEMSPSAKERIDGTERIVIPYAAVIYDVKGDTWVYTSDETLTFVRQLVNVDYIAGDKAVLVEDLPAGVQVATVGVSELYGLDTGVGK